MARFKELYSSFKCASAMSINPSKTATSAGSSKFCTRVSGLSIPVSRESTGLIQYFLIASNSSSVMSPLIT